MTKVASSEFFEIKVNSPKNRLYLTQRKFWNKKVMDDYINQIDKAISSMNNNFTLVTDLREFKALHSELVESSRVVMRKLSEGGMYKVAEILPESVISKMQLDQSTKATNMPNKQFSSVPEGEKWLDAEVQKL